MNHEYYMRLALAEAEKAAREAAAAGGNDGGEQ